VTRPGPDFARVAAQFGADDTQVRRDHLISHVLGALAAHVPTDDVVFFGGTALSRTHVPDGRLSEDIDLIALGPRSDVLRAVEAAVRHGVQRTHGRPAWDPPLLVTTDSQPSVLSAGGLSIRVQVLEGSGYPWPTEVRDIEQRYADAPPARLRTFTAPAFAAAKLAAWVDRRSSRDLWDLAHLADRGLVDAEAAGLFVRHGQFAHRPEDWVFEEPPPDSRWRSDLAHQTRLSLTAEEALERVRGAWARAFDSRGGSTGALGRISG
jgi:predicted nucleotidyltransferase component of viral defense system